jgi:hypothetical protein
VAVRPTVAPLQHYYTKFILTPKPLLATEAAESKFQVHVPLWHTLFSPTQKNLEGGGRLCHSISVAPTTLLVYLCSLSYFVAHLILDHRDLNLDFPACLLWW